MCSPVLNLPSYKEPPELIPCCPVQVNKTINKTYYVFVSTSITTAYCLLNCVYDPIAFLLGSPMSSLWHGQCDFAAATDRPR